MAYELQNQTQYRNEYLLDIRESADVYDKLDHVLVRLLATTFEYFGDTSTIPWREFVPFDTLSHVSLGVWSAYFQIVEQNDEVLRYIFDCLRLSGKIERLRIATAALNNISGFAASRIPFSNVAAFLDALDGVIEESPPRAQARGVVGTTLALFLWAYPEQCDASRVVLAIGRCLPLFPVTVDPMLLIDSLMVVLHHANRMESSEAIIAVLEMLVVLAGDTDSPDACRSRIQDFFRETRCLGILLAPGILLSRPAQRALERLTPP
jgi:hypothetical protein